MTDYDVIVAGASFAGLACAKAASELGARVGLIERKADLRKGLHTTGILVEEAAELLDPPAHLIKRINAVRLFSPSLRSIEIRTDHYFFLSTDTPNLLQHYAEDVERAGVAIHLDTPFVSGREVLDRRLSINDGAFSARFLVGADGARSRVAQAFALGSNTHFLVGTEAEIDDAGFESTDAFYCFLDATHAQGYIGWAIPGVGLTQVGLATNGVAKPDLRPFIAHIAPVLDLRASKVLANRGGLIPVGGLVRPFARGNVILVGDAAGTVSPLTAGGIHTAIYYGRRLGTLIAEHLRRDGPHPSEQLKREYPRFHVKQMLRALYERTPNWAFNAMLAAPGFERFARRVLFLKRRLPSGGAHRD